MIYCKECGIKNDDESIFCTSCGKKLGDDSVRSTIVNQPHTYQQPSAHEQQGYQPQQGYQKPRHQQSYPQYGRFFPQPMGYIRPQDYQFTQSVSERIVGTLKANIHVVEEIEERKDLQSEANKVFIISLIIIAIFKIVSVFISPYWVIYSVSGSIIEIILLTLINGYAFVYLCASIGQRFGKHETQVDRDEILRVLSYAYIAKAIEQILSVVDDIYSNTFTFILWGISWLYALYIVGFALTRALDRGWGTTIGTVIVVSIIIVIITFVLYMIMAAIFGTTYI